MPTMLPTENVNLVPAVDTTAKRDKRAYNQDVMKHFVVSWRTSNSRQEVSDKTGFDIATVSSIASMLRAKDVPLKEMPKGIRESKYDYEELKTLAGVDLSDILGKVG